MVKGWLTSSPKKSKIKIRDTGQGFLLVHLYLLIREKCFTEAAQQVSPARSLAGTGSHDHPQPKGLWKQHQAFQPLALGGGFRWPRRERKMALGCKWAHVPQRLPPAPSQPVSGRDSPETHSGGWGWTPAWEAWMKNTPLWPWLSFFPLTRT